MQGIARALASAGVLTLVVAGCSSDAPDAGDAAATSTAKSEATDPGRGRLTIDGDTLTFAVDVCYEGEGTELSPDLRLHIEGEAADATGERFTIQIVQTHSPTGDLIDVIRARPDGGPIGASREAQRVVSGDGGEVRDQWGDGATPLLEIVRSPQRLTVSATGATFGAYPGGGGDPTVVGTGDLQVTCVPAT